MTVQPQYPPPPYQQQPYVHIKQSGDGSKKFLNMSAGVLMAVIAGVILVCCIGPFAVCFLGGFLGAATDAATPDPTVAITSCKIEDEGFLPSAKVTMTITNNSAVEDFYSIDLEVLDAAGTRVGDGYALITDVAGGKTVTEETTVYLDAKGGTTCKVTKVS